MQMSNNECQTLSISLYGQQCRKLFWDIADSSQTQRNSTKFCFEHEDAKLAIEFIMSVLPSTRVAFMTSSLLMSSGYQFGNSSVYSLLILRMQLKVYKFKYSNIRID